MALAFPYILFNVEDKAIGLVALATISGVSNTLDSIPAILIGQPSAATQVTFLEGHQLARQGKSRLYAGGGLRRLCAWRHLRRDAARHRHSGGASVRAQVRLLGDRGNGSHRHRDGNRAQPWRHGQGDHRCVRWHAARHHRVVGRQAHGGSVRQDGSGALHPGTLRPAGVDRPHDQPPARRTEGRGNLDCGSHAWGEVRHLSLADDAAPIRLRRFPRSDPRRRLGCCGLAGLRVSASCSRRTNRSSARAR